MWRLVKYPKSGRGKICILPGADLQQSPSQLLLPSASLSLSPLHMFMHASAQMCTFTHIYATFLHTNMLIPICTQMYMQCYINIHMCTFSYMYEGAYIQIHRYTLGPFNPCISMPLCHLRIHRYTCTILHTDMEARICMYLQLCSHGQHADLYHRPCILT